MIIILLVAAVAEIMAQATSLYLVKSNIGFSSLHHMIEPYDSYQARRHRRLGWKSIRLDENGDYLMPARAWGGSAAGPHSLMPPCVSAYGDSFMEDFGVKPEDSRSSRLAQLLHCRVANLGVSGCGTDQALAEQGLNFIDLGCTFLRYPGDADLKGLYSPKTMHQLNENGNALLAQTVAAWLSRYKVLPSAGGELTGAAGDR